MATIIFDRACVRSAYGSSPSFNAKLRAALMKKKLRTQLGIRACHSMVDEKEVYKQVGLFSLRRKIEDAVLRAEMFAPMALEMEEARWIEQEEMIRNYNLWDDLNKSNDILVRLADSAKVVDALKDLKYKVEEAKLIIQLAEMNAIDYGFYKQAYDASLDASKILDQYEMSKLLKGPFDLEGACLIIQAGTGGIHHKLWAEQLLSMYLKWAKKQGHEGRVVDRFLFENGGIASATIEFEFECAYSYLSGEKGAHHMIRSSLDESSLLEASSAVVDVVPLFLENSSDLEIDHEDLIISSPSSIGEQKGRTEARVCIQHQPTGISAESSGERTHFANKMKALNRLKAKLEVIAREQGVSGISSIRKDAIVNLWQEETRSSYQCQKLMPQGLNLLVAFYTSL
ncbi:peptide chain release factor PrfB3, chloroplastic isoform X2 [Prosopis cineraria]|uniref:peptide chain release factor PrfB3, chloroplastic isoform X2 n=1 Tax=Prosopis cineraria TaxID=364024 RepID=UPI0024109FC1|nr:peptide chain release factor PrfB3, chloroplastic isoform X2 [Prosopis cineraria]